MSLTDHFSDFLMKENEIVHEPPKDGEEAASQECTFIETASQGFRSGGSLLQLLLWLRPNWLGHWDGVQFLPSCL